MTLTPAAMASVVVASQGSNFFIGSSDRRHMKKSRDPKFVTMYSFLYVAMNKNIAITVFQRVASGLGVHGILVIRHMDADKQSNDIFQRTVNGLLGSMAFL